LKSKINIILPIALALILPLLGNYSNNRLLDIGNKSFFIKWLVTFTILYGLWHVLWKHKNASSVEEKRWYLLGVLVFVLATSGLNYLVEPEIKLVNLIRFTFTLMLFLVIQYALKSQESISLLQLEKEQLQTENYKTQLKAIRSQIDPHFLFNSLNTLRSMVRHQHGSSEKFVMSLSDFYRQTLKHNENSTLPLAEEIEVLQSYLFLMKSRNEEAVSVQMDIDNSLLQDHIPTLALQTVVENCFKHNSMTSKRPLNITISNIKNDYIQVSNNLQAKIGEEESTGLGLGLLRKRYDLMKIKDGVIIKETANHFSVQLKLIKQ